MPGSYDSNHCSVFNINKFTELLQVLSAHCVNVEILIDFEHDVLIIVVLPHDEHSYSEGVLALPHQSHSFLKKLL